jgi:hypothetical protein
MNLTRVWELITGSPHHHVNAAMVSAATHSLAQRTEELAHVIKPYKDSEDPLMMFLTDVFNRREMRPRNGSSKFYS